MPRRLTAVHCLLGPAPELTQLLLPTPRYRTPPHPPAPAPTTTHTHTHLEGEVQHRDAFVGGQAVEDAALVADVLDHLVPGREEAGRQAAAGGGGSSRSSRRVDSGSSSRSRGEGS